MRPDVAAAVSSAKADFRTWSGTKPLERAALMRWIANILRENADDLALLDAVKCGIPFNEMASDARVAAMQIDYFAGLVTEIKGARLRLETASST